MNSDYRFKLERGSRKHRCSACSRKSLVRYIDCKTGEYLPPTYGRCDRESKCAYHLNPYLDGFSTVVEKNNDLGSTDFEYHSSTRYKNEVPTYKAQSIYFDFKTFSKTLETDRYCENIFIQNLLKNVPFPFESEQIRKVVEIYKLGTISNGYRKGAITFPFIDIEQNVRAIQVKQFDKQNCTIGTDFLNAIIEKHHRIKKIPLPDWLKSYNSQEKRVTCLFGEHLLKLFPNNPIALVEAPKTAIYGTLYFGLPNHSDDFIWLAVYNKSSFSYDKLKALKGRKVVVFPDLSKNGDTYNEWRQKAKEFEGQLKGTIFIFSDLLEKLAPQNDRSEGKDFADYLIKLNWREFNNTPKYKINKTNEKMPIPKGKLFYRYELKVKFNLSDDFIDENFEECIAGSLWIPFF